MITLGKGNLLEAQTEALVNTVNCEGYMGKGIALQFKKAFPENYKAYHASCKKGQVVPGKMFTFKNQELSNPKYIINFPTKLKWREKSRIEYIQEGLKSLISEIEHLKISSIAIPPLGCGLGGLNWSQVKPLIESAFKNLPHIEVLLFEPSGSPLPSEMPLKTKKPHLTPARALFIKLLEIYNRLGYRLTILEAQKLAYFLQESGEELRLNYKPHTYGPYADNLSKVIETLEGHYLKQVSDHRSPSEELALTPGAAQEASEFLLKHPESVEKLDRVEDLISGFETPYGMEMLATLHWLNQHHSPPAKNTEEALQGIKNWNERKKNLFKDEHIIIAWERLTEQGWLDR